MNKKVVLFLIIFLPSMMWLVLELSTINSRKLPFYGPKSFDGTDSIYYNVASEFKNSNQENVSIDTTQNPLYIVCFIKQSYKSENYRLAGLSEYAQYKKEKIKDIPVYIISACDSVSCFDEFKKISITNPNIQNLYWSINSFDSLNLSYFKEKPYYVDYSYLVLIDNQRHIRGYYDARYVSEIKRLIEEYQHLRLKEEKKNLLNKNKIEVH